MGIRPSYDCLLSRMSSRICENATDRNRLDLKRLGRRADADCQFQDKLADLKDRIAWMNAARTQPAYADSVVEISSKAS